MALRATTAANFVQVASGHAPTAKGFTAMMWHKLAATGTSEGLFSTQNPPTTAGADGFGAFYDTANTFIELGYISGGSAGGTATTAVAFPTGRWMHLTFLMRPNGSAPVLEIWINGIKAASTTGTLALPADGPVTFGEAGGASAVGLNGDIAHCRFWERPLSAGQIRQAALSANVPSNLRGGLTIELPLQQGTAVLDNLAASGGSSKATITGTLTASFGPPVGYTRDPGLFPPWLRVNTLGHNISVGIASETDSALAIAHAKLKAVGIASETDSALAITAKKARTIGIAQETDSAPSIIFTKAKLIGIAGETDSAPTITRSGHKITVTTASETDSAPGVGFTKQKAIGIASETDSALSVNRAKAKAIGIPVETDSALAIGHTRQRQIGIASEQDSALAVTRAGVTTTRRHGGLVVGVGIFVPEATPEET